MSKTFLIRVILFIVIPLGLMGWAGYRFMYQDQTPEEVVEKIDLSVIWGEHGKKVEQAREEYKAGLQAKRANKKDEAIPRIEKAVSLLDEAIKGGEGVIEANRKALIAQGKSTADADDAAETYRVELERWRAEYNDANGLLGSMKGSKPAEVEGTGG